jgi:NADPH:quinone reductase-like Zn-dependent oxidoreductase
VIRDGAHAQYAAVAADWLSEKPANLSMEQAAAVGVPYIAAWSALVQAANIQAGETVLITGVSGAGRPSRNTSRALEEGKGHRSRRFRQGF